MTAMAASTSLVCRSAHMQNNRGTICQRSVRRTALARPVVMIGNINDPEKTRQNKEKKGKEGMWAEPSNKNPLEKVTLMRDNPEGDTDQQNAERDVAAEEIKQKGDDGLTGAKKAVSDVVDKVKDAVSGDK